MGKGLFYPKLAATNLRKNHSVYRPYLLAVVLLAWMGVFSVPLSFCMEGIVRGLCAVTAFPFQLAQYYFF